MFMSTLQSVKLFFSSFHESFPVAYVSVYNITNVCECFSGMYVKAFHFKYTAKNVNEFVFYVYVR